MFKCFDVVFLHVTPRFKKSSKFNARINKSVISDSSSREKGYVKGLVIFIDSTKTTVLPSWVIRDLNRSRIVIFD